MKKYILIHNTTTNTEEFIIKSFTFLEEINDYITSIQDVIDNDDLLFTFYKKLENGSYHMYEDMYSLTHGIKSITIGN